MMWYILISVKCRKNVIAIKNIFLALKRNMYDLREKYSDLYLKQEDAIWDIFSKIFNETKKKFILLWMNGMRVFHMSFMTEKNREDYLLFFFLKLLLKGQSYVELAYMTGVCCRLQNIFPTWIGIEYVSGI